MREKVYHRRDGLVRTIKVEGDGTTILQTYQDMEPIIEENKRLRENMKSYGHRGEVLRKIATIPVDVYEKAYRESRHDDPDWLQKWLNDHDNKVFRVWEGTV